MAEKRTAAAVVTPYIIMYRIPEQTGQGWTELVQADGSPVVVESRGQEQCIRDALHINTDLAKLANSEVGVEILVLPQRSYKPVPVRLVPQAPVIKVG